MAKAFRIKATSPATKQFTVTATSWGAIVSFKNARAMISGPMPQGSPGVMAMILGMAMKGRVDEDVNGNKNVS
jgi:hypothetical protein